MWQPIDFQRLVNLDKSLVDQLHHYLQEKEAELGESILSAVPIQADSLSPPVLSPGKLAVLKLSDAVEGFRKKIRRLLHGEQGSFKSEIWQEVSQKVNQAFWEYDEVLEGCVKELFQQLEQLELEQWNKELALVLDALKDMLLHQIEDLIWALKRMETSLSDFRLACEARQGKWMFFRKLLAYWRPLIDRTLLLNLKKSEKFLRINHKKFAARFASYIELDGKVRETMKKLVHYQALSHLDEELQERYRILYYHVKLWQYNDKARGLPVQEIIRALFHTLNIESAILLYKEYVASLKNALYEQSRNLKKRSTEYQGKAKKEVLKSTESYLRELRSLGSTVARYRDFLLRTDPNPYVRARWGFSEWIVGPEPEQTKQLLNLEYELENLEDQFKTLLASIERGPKYQVKKNIRKDPEVQRILHEMGQPLTSYNMTRTRAEYIVMHLADMDELGSFNPRVVPYCGKLFSRAIRADWKYHVLHEFPEFHKLYNLHIGIVGPIEDRKHFNRINKFKQLVNEILEWVKKRQVRRHEHEVEQNMSDLKGYLQDFLAQVQRLSTNGGMKEQDAKKVIDELALQLLIYRFTFGDFFSKLGRFEYDGQRVRNKLLFVDQYFASIENKLKELRQIDWSSHASHEPDHT